MSGFLIAVISGCLMSVQGIFNTGVSKQAGMFTTASFVQFIALLVCLAAWFITGKDGSFQELFAIERKYMLLGGALGAFITITVVKAMGHLGPERATMVIVVAQMLCSYLVELLGLFGVEKVAFEWKKVIGVMVAALGIVIFNKS